jgi:hypothetical protein
MAPTQAFGSGYDEGQTKTYRDLAVAVRDMQPREVNPSAYEDVLVMFEALQAFLTGEDKRLTELGNELSKRETALVEAERRLALEKRAVAIMPKRRDATLTTEHPSEATQAKLVFGRSLLWGRQSTTIRG